MTYMSTAVRSDSVGLDTGRRRLIGLLVAVSLEAWSGSAGAGVVSRAATRAAARRTKASRGAVENAQENRARDVIIQRSRHPEAASHIDHAQSQGQPSVLHVDRVGAEARRRASTGSVNRSTSPRGNYDRDEYPPAFTKEGGANANVRFIDRADNRGAGSSIGQQTRDLKDGDKIRLIVTD